MLNFQTMHLLFFLYLFDNSYLLFHVSSGQNFVTTHNWTKVFHKLVWSQRSRKSSPTVKSTTHNTLYIHSIFWKVWCGIHSETVNWVREEIHGTKLWHVVEMDENVATVLNENAASSNNKRSSSIQWVCLKYVSTDYSDIWSYLNKTLSLVVGSFN